MPITLSDEQARALGEKLAFVRRTISNFKETGEVLVTEKSHYIKSSAGRQFLKEAGNAFMSLADQGMVQLTQAELLIWPPSQPEITNVESSESVPE